ncbi:MAG: helicase C-terminal domain-containing protein [Caldilineaceae bacterium]
MTERVYVALDLETTGLDAKRDQIIEIGAVRFQGNQILDQFITFVNPGRTIPLRIQQLTGIRNSDVSKASALAAVAPELLAFVGTDVAAVVAHNAGFDMGFLRAAGIHFQRPVLDTFELATILLPSMSSYSLSELCHALQIPLEDAHRALDDALATAHLFNRLNMLLASLPMTTLDTIVEAGHRETEWPPLLLFERARDRRRHEPSYEPSPLWTSAQGEVNKAPTQVLPTAQADVPAGLLTDESALTQTIPAEVIDRFFAADGPLARHFGTAYEVRHSQVQMAQQVLRALNQGDHMLLEAGTGTGKSLAYLAPAALWSAANERRVVIATNTITLQEQLLERDLPHLDQVLQSVEAVTSAPASRQTWLPNTALLKGRSNYLCLRRLHTWRASRRLSAAELVLLAKVLVWLPTTTTGDVSELFLANATERALWQRICSDAATCTPERCGDQASQSQAKPLDFFYHARHQAERAHLLIVNHALLIADLSAEGRVLPPYSHLIVDEAHRLDEAATDQLTYRIEWSWVTALLRRLTLDDTHMTQLHYLARQQGAGSVQDQLNRITRAAGQFTQHLHEFADRLLYVAQHQSDVRRDAGYPQQIHLDARRRTQSQWSQIELIWEQTGNYLSHLLDQTRKALQQLDGLRWWQKEPEATLLNELQGIYEQLQTLAVQLDDIVFQADQADGGTLITWMELNEDGNSVSLLAAPLYVNELLEKLLVLPRRTAIFTGATLRTGSGFTFIRDRLGLWHATALTVDSPFDYATSTLLMMPHDLPMPDHPYYQQAVERAIIDATLATGGRTLVLFTSYAQLRTTADAIRSELDRAGITVLEHGTSSRTRLLREYRRLEKAVLLGTRSFWEGVDLPGDELRCLLIVRLPFAVPSDPIVAARSRDLENSFGDYMLPDAILRFRQGFGRLIRRATDRGVVVLLDSRLWRKEYGGAFLESLPPCTISQAPLANLNEEISAWLTTAS